MGHVGGHVGFTGNALQRLGSGLGVGLRFGLGLALLASLAVRFSGASCRRAPGGWRHVQEDGAEEAEGVGVHTLVWAIMNPAWAIITPVWVCTTPVWAGATLPYINSPSIPRAPESPP